MKVGNKRAEWPLTVSLKGDLSNMSRVFRK